MSRVLQSHERELALERFTSAQGIVIFSHASPDGDAVGSSLGLYHILSQMGKQVQVVLPDHLPRYYNYLPGLDQVVFADEDKSKARNAIESADLWVICDFNNWSRVGKQIQGWLSEIQHKPTVMIDHHQQPDTFPVVLFSDISFTSTSEMVYHFAEQLGWKEYISLESMQCLYTGMVTDTASFRFPVVTGDTHRIVAEMLDKGLKHAAIHQAIYDSQSLDRLRLTGYALSEKLEVYPDQHVAIISLSKDELLRFRYQSGDTEGLVNQALSIEGVQMAAFLRETPEGDGVKCSFRSVGDWDVNQFARANWNGGGHKNAAGGKTDVSLENALADLRKQLNVL